MSLHPSKPMYELPLSRLHSLADAERERDRYRSALEWIASEADDQLGPDMARRIAREALDG